MFEPEAIKQHYAGAKEVGYAGIFAIDNLTLPMRGAYQVPAGELVDLDEVKERISIHVDPDYPDSYVIPPKPKNAPHNRKQEILSRREAIAAETREVLLNGRQQQLPPDGSRISSRPLREPGTRKAPPTRHEKNAQFTQVLGDVVRADVEQDRIEPLPETIVAPVNKNSIVRSLRNHAPAPPKNVDSVRHSREPVGLTFFVDPWTEDPDGPASVTTKVHRVTDQGALLVLAYDSNDALARPQIPVVYGEELGIVLEKSPGVVFIVQQQRPLVDGPNHLYIFDVVKKIPINDSGVE